MSQQLPNSPAPTENNCRPEQRFITIQTTIIVCLLFFNAVLASVQIYQFRTSPRDVLTELQRRLETQPRDVLDELHRIEAKLDKFIEASQ